MTMPDPQNPDVGAIDHVDDHMGSVGVDPHRRGDLRPLPRRPGIFRQEGEGMLQSGEVGLGLRGPKSRAPVT